LKLAPGAAGAAAGAAVAVGKDDAGAMIVGAVADAAGAGRGVPQRQVSMRVGTRREHWGQIQEIPDSPVAMRSSSPSPSERAGRFYAAPADP